jgi:hypothetical protein
VTVFSTERLAVYGTGVTVETIAQTGSRYRYRYAGLRLLTRSDGRYLLLPVGWRKGRDQVFVLPDTDQIRIDVRAR